MFKFTINPCVASEYYDIPSRSGFQISSDAPLPDNREILKKILLLFLKIQSIHCEMAVIDTLDMKVIKRLQDAQVEFANLSQQYKILTVSEFK